MRVHCTQTLTKSSLVPRPSLSLSFAVTIVEAGKKELVKRLTNSFFLSCLHNCYCKRKREGRPGNEARFVPAVA